jgi:hypothetical protein
MKTTFMADDPSAVSELALLRSMITRNRMQNQRIKLYPFHNLVLLNTELECSTAQPVLAI